MIKILIVEDEEDMATGLVFNLEARGYKVNIACDGEAGLAAAEREKPDLIILDIMLPRKDGYQVCRELREKGVDTPILMLTARSEEADKVLGLDMGADDFLTKPFGVLELLARVKALLRRSEGQKDFPEVYSFGDVVIDFKRYRAAKGEVPANLTPREFEIMRLFIQRQGETISRNQFLDEVWGYDRYPTTRTVDTHIAKLRRKLEQNPESPRFIITVHGIGYKFIG